MLEKDAMAEEDESQRQPRYEGQNTIKGDEAWSQKTKESEALREKQGELKKCMGDNTKGQKGTAPSEGRSMTRETNSNPATTIFIFKDWTE